MESLQMKHGLQATTKKQIIVENKKTLPSLFLEYFL